MINYLPSLDEIVEGYIFCIDKPAGWTSFDVVNKMKKRLPRKLKIGHTGTLDPFATGLIIVCTGRKTKEIQDLQDGAKTYLATMIIGATTPTYDPDSEIEEIWPISHITESSIRAIGHTFIGTIDQTIPAFSAVKIDGQRAYKLARKGKEFKLKTRSVFIDALCIHSIDFLHKEIRQPSGVLPHSYIQVEFEVVCHKGTYIRSIAYDWGKALGSGAYLISLRRIGNGRFDIRHSWSLERITAHLETLIKNQ